ncbi:ATV_collapsed_G0027210.mRNA.1.CDS.1 [Saccharomyces cerevisiae]|nr:ATV_collapsed_G0027210.mRNA.1.CDS.1 [Saccharomyces cerevisiae]
MNTLKASGKKRAYFMEEEYGTLELLLQIHKGKGYEIILCGYERQTNTGSLLILSESGEKIANLAANLGSILQNLKRRWW